MALTDDLVSYWKLDEASGTRNDSHSTNHLTDNNTVGSTTGKLNNCATFVADDTEYLSVANNAELQVGDIDFSISCWCYFTAAAGIQYVFCKTAAFFPYALSYNNVGGADEMKFEAYFNNTVVKTGAFAINTWMHVVCINDSVANQCTIIINDGTPTSNAHGAFANTDGAGDLRIGGSDASGQYLAGRVDEIGLWKRVLTAGEITTLYGGGTPPAYPFSGGGGGTVNLTSGKLGMLLTGKL